MASEEATMGSEGVRPGRWYLRCAYQSAPNEVLGWISGGWTDNQYITVSADKGGAWPIDFPLYAYGGETFLKNSEHDWYDGADGDDKGGDARWRYWNRARAIIWDTPGAMTSTISLKGLPNVKLTKPSSGKGWAVWSASSPETTLLLTWDRW